MFNSLSCVPATNLDPNSFGTLFGNVCGQSGSPCTGISSNVTTGVYGAFSMCNSTEQLGYALDTYYHSQNSASTACDWNGQAKVVQGATPASSCQAILSSASASNSFAATATAASSSSSIAVPMPMKNAFTIRDFAVGLYVVVAMIAGAGLVVL